MVLKAFFFKSWLHRLFLVTGSSLLFVTPFAMMYYYQILDNPSPAFLILVIGLSTLLLFLLVMIQARSSRWYTFFGTLLSVPLLLWATLHLLVSWYIQPFLAGLILFCGCIAFLKQNRFKTWMLYAWVTAVLAVMFFLSIRIPRIESVLPFYAGGVGIVLYLMTRFRVFDLFPKALVFSFLVSAPCLCLNGFFYQGIAPDLANRVRSQLGLTFLFDYSQRDDPLVKAIGPSTFWVHPVDSGETYIVGTRITAKLIKFSPHEPHSFEQKPLYKDHIIDLIDGISDVIGYDDQTRNWYLGYRSRLFRLDPVTFQILAEAPIPKHDIGSGMVNIIRVDQKNGRVICMVDVDRFLYFHDAETLEPLFQMEFTDHLWDFVVDGKGNQIIASSTGMGGSRVRFFDLDSLELKKEIKPNWYFAYITLDQEGRRIFGASTVTGDLVTIDIDRHLVLSRIPVEPGIRYSAYDRKRNRIYVGGYSRGNLSFVDLAQERVTARYNLGYRVRTVFFSEKTQKITATSSVGGFEIDPDVASSVKNQ